jgi:hypothetical protein
MNSRRRVNSDVMFLRLTTVSALILFAFAPALCCECNAPPETAEAVLKHYDGVFAGRVLRIKYPETKRTRNRVVFLSHLIYVTLKVERTWKSADSDEITIATPFSDCYYPFKVDQEYLVWAYSNGEAPQTLVTDLCAKTIKLADASRDLNALGEGRVPRRKGETQQIVGRERRERVSQHEWSGDA